MYSCSNEKDFPLEIQVTEIDTTKLINFGGLLVSHRFSTPKKELTEEHTVLYLKKMFRKVREKAAKKKGLVFKSTSDELPDIETIVAGVERVMEQFPFKQAEDVFKENSTVDIDTIPIEVKEQLILDGILTQDGYSFTEEDRIAEEKQKAQAEANREMIQKDFPTLTEEQIDENTELIDSYYAQN